MPDQATIHLSVTNAKTGQVTLNETFHLAADMTGALLKQLEAVVAELPPQRVRVSRRQEKGATILEVEVLPRPKATDPSFEKLYRHKKQTEAHYDAA